MIPISPAGVQIAGVAVFIDPANPAHFPNKVELKATIGIDVPNLGDFPNILISFGVQVLKFSMRWQNMKKTLTMMGSSACIWWISMFLPEHKIIS